MRGEIRQLRHVRFFLFAVVVCLLLFAVRKNIVRAEVSKRRCSRELDVAILGNAEAEHGLHGRPDHTLTYRGDGSEGAREESLTEIVEGRDVCSG